MAVAKADFTAPPTKAPAKPEPAAPAAEPAAPAAVPAPAKRSVLGAWLPAIAAILLAPAVTWTTVEFAVLPRLQKKVQTAAELKAEPVATTKKVGKDGKEVRDPAANYEFQNVVVNLAGTMGTRYLKTSFIVAGTDNTIKTVFETERARMLDITRNVLSGLTLPELEEPGASNVIREKLVSAYNQALGRKVAEQIYFTDFLVQ